MKELVSVIVPVYNAENTIKKCVDSLLDQSYQNLEILLVDDGSKDLSGTILDTYAGEEKRIRVFHRENQGVSAARNFGLSMSEGTYLFFVDADDFVDREYIRELVSGCREGTLPICARWEIFMPRGVRKRIDFEGYPREGTFHELFPRLYQDGFLNSLWDKVYLGEIIRKNHLKFPEELSLGEDLLFNLSYFSRIERVALIRTPLYFYIRYESGSLRTKEYRAPDRIQTRLYTALFEFSRDFFSLPEFYPLCRRCVADIMDSYIVVWEKDKSIGAAKKYVSIRKAMKKNRLLLELTREMQRKGCISRPKFFLIQKQMFLTYYLFKKGYLAVRDRKAGGVLG